MADPDDDDEGPEVPIEGTMCSVHADRMAFRICPACTRNACLTCWHPSISRCHACLVKDASTFPAIPWEDRTRNIFGRLFFTLSSALSPDSSAPGFARETDTSGAVFAVLTIVPFGLLAGIIPYTRTLLFGNSFEIIVARGADSSAIAIDVLVAAFTGLLVTVVSWLAVALPYVSLSRAYADRGVATAPVRLMNYRGWLIPLNLLLMAVLPWCLPAPAPGSDPGPAVLLSLLLSMIPIVLLMAAMRSAARMGSGASPVAVLAILLVPLALLYIAQQKLLAPLAPSPEEIAADIASATTTATTPTTPAR